MGNYIKSTLNTVSPDNASILSHFSREEDLSVVLKVLDSYIK